MTTGRAETWTGRCPRAGMPPTNGECPCGLLPAPGKGFLHILIAVMPPWLSRLPGNSAVFTVPDSLTLFLPLILPATLAGNSQPTPDSLTVWGPPSFLSRGESSRGLSKGRRTPAAGLGEHTEHLGFPTTLSVLTPGVMCSQPTLSMLQGGVTVPVLVLREAKQLA